MPDALSPRAFQAAADAIEDSFEERQKAAEEMAAGEPLYTVKETLQVEGGDFIAVYSLGGSERRFTLVRDLVKVPPPPWDDDEFEEGGDRIIERETFHVLREEWEEYVSAIHKGGRHE